MGAWHVAVINNKTEIEMEELIKDLEVVFTSNSKHKYEFAQRLITSFQNDSGEQCVMHDVVASKPDVKAALDKAVSAIWFNDNSDYLRALYGIISSLTGIDDLTDQDIERLFKELNPE